MLKCLSETEAQRLRDFFREANYTPETFESRRAQWHFPSPAAGELPVLLESTLEPSLANLVLCWFLLNRPVTSELAGDFVPASVQELLLECGMLIREEGRLKPAVMLTPWDQYLFAADSVASLESHSPDLVIWPNPTSRTLLEFTIRRPVQTTLDLGAGCGIQAILAAQHSQQVTATDLNPRAVQFVSFNCWLNGTGNVECLTGDTFAPVTQRAFDLILANPPFFITPSVDRTYSENDMELDRYCRRIAREAPAYLREGGYLQMVCEWAQLRGQSWQDSVAEWMEGSSCDAWILHRYGRDPAAYARQRIHQTVPVEAAPAEFAHWMEYYRQRGVESIHGGVLAMRRRSGRNWIRLEDSPVTPKEPFGEGVWEAFACFDLLECPDEELLDAHIRLSPDIELDQQSRQSEGQWKLSVMTLRSSAGIPVFMRVDPQVAEFLAGLDGSRRLREAVHDLAQQVHAEAAAVERDCLGIVRKLIARRFARS